MNPNPTNGSFLRNSQPGEKEIPTFAIKESTATSYASATQKNLHPKRDQGLILDVIDDLNLTDYVCAVGELVQPKNVLYASRISNNRICIYLASKELVLNLTDKYAQLIIEQKSVPIRPLISNLKRIIFSNVSPTIPNHVLENILDEIKVKRGSPVNLLKASISREGYSHVASFRRQLYVEPNDAKKFPKSSNYNTTI